MFLRLCPTVRPVLKSAILMTDNKYVQCSWGQSHTGVLGLWVLEFGMYLFSCFGQPAIKMKNCVSLTSLKLKKCNDLFIISEIT